MQKFKIWLEFLARKWKPIQSLRPWSVTSSLWNVFAGIFDSMARRWLKITKVTADKKHPFLTEKLDTVSVALKESKSIRITKNALNKNILQFITQI